MKKILRPQDLKFYLLFTLATALFLTAFQQAQPGALSPWIWVVIIAVLLFIVWWYFRTRRPVSTPVQMETKSQPIPAAPDDLTIIEGIGPKINDVLQTAGITTFNQLAATDVNSLRVILRQSGMTLADPGTWAEQARLAAVGDQAGLMALQDRLKAGRVV